MRISDCVCFTLVYLFFPEYLNSEQQLWFLGVYRKLAKYTCPVNKPASVAHTHTPSTFTLALTDADEVVESECSRWCAYNLPVSFLYSSAYQWFICTVHYFCHVPKHSHFCNISALLVLFDSGNDAVL